MKLLLLTVLLSGAAWNAAAGERPYDDKTLMDIIGWIKNADGYTYELTIRSHMKADSADNDLQHSVVYSSVADSTRYISGTADCIFMSRHGMFHVDHRAKSVAYKQYTAPDIAAKVLAAATPGNVGRLLDSMLLDKARISAKKTAGQILEYMLAYPADYMMKSLRVRWDNQKKILHSLSYVLERPRGGVRPEEGGVVRQTVTMQHYLRVQPAGLGDILAKSYDLASYLRTTYTGYTIYTL